MKKLSAFLIGILTGLISAGLAVWLLMPAMMLSVYPSRYGFEETLALLQRETENMGWKVSKVYDIQQSLKNAGHEDMTRASIVSICQPHHAYRILNNDDNKKVLAVMPCRVGIYEGKDGKTYITEMNIGLMGKMFGGTIAEVMGNAAADERQILASLIERTE